MSRESKSKISKKTLYLVLVSVVAVIIALFALKTNTSNLKVKEASSSPSVTLI